MADDDAASKRSSGSARSRSSRRSGGSGSTRRSGGTGAAGEQDEVEESAPRKQTASAARQALLTNSRESSQAAREAAKANRFMTTWSETLHGAGAN